MSKGRFLNNFPVGTWWVDNSTGRIFLVFSVGRDQEGEWTVRELLEVGKRIDHTKPLLRSLSELNDAYRRGQLTEHAT